MANEIALDQLITTTPEVCAGKPRIAGRRVTVQNIAIMHERLGLTADQIAIEHGLTLTEVHAALAYYFGHRDEIERSIRQDQALVDAIRQANPSLLKQKLHGE